LPRREGEGTEREPITGVWAGPPSEIQGQSTWWGQGAKPSPRDSLKLKAFCPFSYVTKEGLKDLSDY